VAIEIHQVLLRGDDIKKVKNHWGRFLINTNPVKRFFRLVSEPVLVFNLGAVVTPQELWTIFGGVASRYFMYTAQLYYIGFNRVL